jgi:membrane protease YdiL (CAAX protease family)
MPPSLTHAAGALELGLILAGVVLLWRLGVSPAARSRRGLDQLAPWDLPFFDFLVFLFLVLTASFLAAALGGALARSSVLGLRGDAVTVCVGASAQLGMLAGVVLFRLRVEPRPFALRLASRSVLTAGFATFLVSLPLLIGTAALWEFALKELGLPVDRQDLIGMFANADSPWLLAVMIALAVVIAPLNEELVFRAGVFRYLRTRLPRWAALLLPALTFAALHVNWQTWQGLASLAPLVVLAIVLAIAYERTGNIGTSIAAHAFFNLNTIVVILSGLNA